MRGAVGIGLFQVCLGFCAQVLGGAVWFRMEALGGDLATAILVGSTIFILGTIIMYSGIMVINSELENRLWHGGEKR